MNVFVKYFVYLLCVKCVVGLNEDGSPVQSKSPDTSDKKIPGQQKTEQQKHELEGKLSNNLEVKTATLGFEKPLTLNRIIRAADPRGRKFTSTIEMYMSIKPGAENLEESPQETELSDEDYVFYKAANGSLKLHRAPATWSDARLICYDEGAELASPENDGLMEAMGEVLMASRRPPMHIFTGVNDLYSKGFFTSLRGTPLSAMAAPWAPREPNNVNHFGNCLIMKRDGPLLDSKCDDAYPYICYKKQKLNQTDLCGTTDIEYVFDRVTKSCYKIHPQFVSWQESYATCAREGAYLAILNSDYEAKALARLIKTEWIWAHIGFSYWRKDLWVTIHGETLSEAGFDSWAPGEPNDYNEERCGSLAADVSALVDIDCLDHARPFICEKSSVM